jgi:protein SCO1
MNTILSFLWRSPMRSIQPHPVSIIPWCALSLACLAVMVSAQAGPPALGSVGLATARVPATAQPLAVRPELGLERTEDHDFDPPEPGTYDLPAIKRAADGEVLLTSGAETRLEQLLGGRVSILSFIYLRCRSPRACPHATGVLRQIHELSQEDRVLIDNLQLLTLSFDPAFDTPQRMAAYAQWFDSDGPASPWQFLTTRSEEHLAPILRAYDQVVDRRPDLEDETGPLTHPVRVYLVDRELRIRNIYSFAQLDPRLLLADVRTLLLEK